MLVRHTPPIMMHAYWHVTVMTDHYTGHLGGLLGVTQQAQHGCLSAAVRSVRHASVQNLHAGVSCSDADQDSLRST